jgi:LmbE family N-acetylglucosaminyl deacetylase
MTMPQETPLDCLAVGAHPDDVEIACGGTLAKLSLQGYRVGIVDLTDGEPTPHSPGPEVRLAEARQAAEILGVQVRMQLNLPNRRLFDSFEARIALAKLFRRYRPRLVIGMFDKTPLASPDHYQAVQITDAAVFYSRLSKWDEYFDALPVYHIPTYLGYSLAFGAVPQITAGGQIVADISDTLDTKLRAIQCYHTQFAHKRSIVQRVQGLAWQVGHAAGVDAGELLLSPRPLVTQDLMGLLFQPESRHGEALRQS